MAEPTVKNTSPVSTTSPIAPKPSSKFATQVPQPGMVRTVAGDIPMSEFSDVVYTAEGNISREDYDALLAQYPDGVPSSAIAEVVKEKPGLKSTAEMKIEVARTPKPVDITGTVGELPTGPAAAKDENPELAAMVDSGAPASEIYAKARTMPGAYAAGVAAQLEAQLRAAGELRDEEQFKAYQTLGYVPKGSQFVDLVTYEDMLELGWTPEQLAKSYPDLKPGGAAWNYYTPEQATTIQSTQRAMETLSRYGNDVLAAIEGGDIEAVQVLGVTPDQETADVSDKDWRRLSQDDKISLTILGLQNIVMDKREWERTTLPTLSPEYQQAYRDEGFAGVQQLQQVKQQEWEQTVLPTLPPEQQENYRTGNLDAVNEYIGQQMALYAEQQDILNRMRAGGHTTVSGSPGHEEESFDWLGAVYSGTVAPNQLEKLGLDKTFIDATQDYATQVRGLVGKVDEGVKPTGSGLSSGIGLTGSEAIDLGTAIREAGLDIQGGSAVVTWRNLTDEQKYQVANVLAGYPGFGEFLPSTYRGLQSVASDESLGLPAKIGLSVATAPFTAIITPFVKDMTVGELKEKVDPYAGKNAKGEITDYNLTQYLKDNPYDAPLLARGGFSVDEIEKAQKGDKVNVMPEGATPLDWAIAGVMAASFVLPVLRWGAVGLATRLVGGTGLTAATAPGYITAAMRALQIAYRGAALGELAIKWGLPAGMTAYDVINWKNWTPEQRAVAGVFTGLTYIPILGSLYRSGAGNIAKIRAMSGDSAISPRGLTTGYQDVYAVKPPPDFFAGAEPSTRTQLMQIAYDTKAPTTARLNQVAELLEPTVVAPAFRQTAEMSLDLAGYKTPSNLYVQPDVVIGSISGMTPEAAKAITDWLANHPDVYVGGSLSMVAQGVPLTPHDIDIYTSKSRSVAEDYVRELTNIMVRNGVRVEKVEGDGGVGVDINWKGKQLPLPYGLELLKQPPITVGGVRFQTLGEQALRYAQVVLSPGVGGTRGLMGPRVETLSKEDFPVGKIGTYSRRVKDIAKFQMLVRYIIDQLSVAGETARSAKLQKYLDTFNKYDTRLQDGSIKPLSVEETEQLRQAFLDVMNEAQLLSLTSGDGAMVLDPSTGLVISKIVSPAGETLPGTVYFASRDLTADIAMLQTKGKWGPTQRQVFFSPEAAYDFLINRETGELGPNAGIIAVRTDPSVDMGPNGIIKGPFRYETDANGNPIIYNELVSEAEFYTTEPNTRALSSDGVTNGVTGESVTYYPRTKTKVPILWTATKAASMRGLGAPTPAEVSTINSMAWKASFWDLLHPHWAEITTSEIPASVRSNLVEFYRDTYKVKQLSPEKLDALVKSGAKEVRDTAITNLKSRNEKLTEANVLGEVANIYRKKLTDLVKDIEKVTGVRVSKELTDSIAISLAQGGTSPVEELTGLLEALGPSTKSTVVKDAQSGYDTAVSDDPAVNTDTVADALSSSNPKRLYYLNLGKISTKLAALASTASILNATAPAITSTVLPMTSITSSKGTVSPTAPTTPVPPTTVGGITTPPITPTVPTVPTTPTTPTTPTEIPTSVITPTTPPTVPTEPTVPTTPTTPPPPPTTPKPKPKPKPTAMIRLGKGEGERVKIPDGSITFAWGKVLRGSGANKRKVPVWRYIPPPWTQSKPETLYAPPIGAKNIDSSNPYTTVQMIGQADSPVPERVAIDLGITDAFVSGGGKSISFGGGGLKTNVGERIDSTTQGMTVKEDGEAKGHAYATDDFEPHSVSKPNITKTSKEPIRGGGMREIRSEKDRPYITQKTEEMLEGTYEEPEPAPTEERDDFDYEALDELGAVGTFGDEDPNWLRQNSQTKKKKSINRTQNKRIIPRRGDNPTTMGRIGL